MSINKLITKWMRVGGKGGGRVYVYLILMTLLIFHQTLTPLVRNLQTHYSSPLPVFIFISMEQSVRKVGSKLLFIAGEVGSGRRPVSFRLHLSSSSWGGGREGVRVDHN